MTDWRGRIGETSWMLLPLRGFLGFVYIYAGVSKIADRRFFDHGSPRSMYASILAVRHNSPIGDLLGPVQNHTTLFGSLMAIGELAVGLGILVGLFTRIAAVGGMLLAFSLWLTVSWGAVPWFTSADLVYVFAFTPLLIVGAGELSADAWLARARIEHPAEDRVRRVLVAGGLGAIGAVLLGGAALARESKPRRAALGHTTPTPIPSPSATTTPPATSSGSTSPSSSAPPVPSGPVLTSTSSVPVGGAVQVDDPQTGTPVYVLQLQQGQFTALSAICTHEGCTVDFVSAQLGFRCPCHQSQFSATGAVTQGPAPTNLATIPVQVADGQVHSG